MIAGVLLCLTLGFGFARTQEIPEDNDPDPTLQITLQDARLSVEGNVSSVANEAILRKIANDLFADTKADFTLRTDVVTPPGWALLTELVLRAMSQTNSSSGSIGMQRINIRGVTADFSGWIRAAMYVEENLRPGMEFTAQVIEIQPTKSFVERCGTLFRAIWHDKSIAFSRGSDQVNSSAYGILDELVQLIADCPGGRLTITGHTDNTGDENSNIELSRLRAKAVANYVIARGISPDRLTSKGLGSAKPLLDEDSYRARQLNRRIDIEWSNP